jgi:hypothetical protein
VKHEVKPCPLCTERHNPWRTGCRWAPPERPWCDANLLTYHDAAGDCCEERKAAFYRRWQALVRKGVNAVIEKRS